MPLPKLVKRISDANIFEGGISCDAAQSRLIDDLMDLFGGRPKPVMARLIETGKLTLEDVNEADAELRKLARKDSPK